jgi:recombinational DNA repair protein RecT
MATDQKNALKVLESQIKEAGSVREVLTLAQDRFVKNYSLVTGKKDGHQRFETELLNYLDIVNMKTELQAADKFSHFAAVMKAATTGLSFKSDGHLYPIVYSVGDKKVVKVEIGAHGKKEMLRMMPEIKFIHEGVCVMKGDHFIHDKLNNCVKEHYTTDKSVNSNKFEDVYAAYTRIEWKDGRVIDVVLYHSELEKAKSKSKNQGANSVWNEWPLEMSKKVTYHRAKKLYHRYPDGVIDFGGDAASSSQDGTEDVDHTVVTTAEGENVDVDSGEVMTPEVVEGKQSDRKKSDKKNPSSQESFV